MKVYGEAAIAKFANRHPGARKPLQRFLEIARGAAWSHFPAVKASFRSTDYAAATGTIIFDIGGNKYRLMARIDFEEQILYIEKVMTHEDYNREAF